MDATSIQVDKFSGGEPCITHELAHWFSFLISTGSALGNMENPYPQALPRCV